MRTRSNSIETAITDRADGCDDGVIVDMRGIGRTYQLGEEPLHVLQDIDLTLKRGEYMAVMGPSGSGKSTLLNLLGCLDQPSRGVYRLGDQDVSNMDDDQLSWVRGQFIGFVFQSYNLISQLNVIENIEAPLFYQGVSNVQSRERAVHLADRVGLSNRLKHRPTELSGGQQQRVAIARALANDPILVLADEPTGNLDSESGRDILVMLDELHQSGKTLIIVTHDPQVAQRAHRILHLLDGRIERIEVTGN